MKYILFLEKHEIQLLHNCVIKCFNHRAFANRYDAIDYYELLQCLSDAMYEDEEYEKNYKKLKQILGGELLEEID